MIRTRCASICAGLSLATALCLSGCAAERASRPAFGWARNLLPFGSGPVAESDPSEATDPGSSAALTPLTEGTHAPRSDEYKAPTPPPFAPLDRTKPPPAPPAAAPEFYFDEPDGPTQSTSGRSSPEGRPARLRDAFESWRRHPPERPTIPLDKPVAQRAQAPRLQVVEFRQLEPVVLGAPVFDSPE